MAKLNVARSRYFDRILVLDRKSPKWDKNSFLSHLKKLSFFWNNLRRDFLCMLFSYINTLYVKILISK